MRKWGSLTLTLLLAASLLLGACAPTAEPTQAVAPTATPQPTKAPEIGTESKPLTMVFVPSGDTQAILAGAKELDALIKEETGLVVESSVATSYAASIEALGAGKADIVWFAPFAYVLAHDKYNAEVLLITVRFGSPTYHGQIMYNKEKNPDMDSLDDLKGKKFAFTDPASTSGWLYPATLLKANGIDPEVDLEATFVGSHNAAALAVYKGQVDAGACYDDCRSTIAKDFPDVKDKVEILAYTDEIPNDTVSVRADLPAEVKTKLKEGLLKIAETEKGKEVLEAIYEIGGLVEGNDAMFDPVRQAASAMGIDLEEAVKPPTPKPEAKKIKVGLVTDVGKVDDGTFNEFAYRGMMRAVEEFGLESAFIETVQPTDYEKNIEQFTSEGFDMIITVGYMIGDATKAAAEKNPDIKFAIVDNAYDPPVDNIMGLVFSEDQSGFLAGALAGLMTKSKTVGIVAGMEIPPVIKFRKGYEAGVKYVCSDCEVLGVYIDSFTDPARGKTAALSQIDEGADVIFGAGGPTGSGGILGAAQAGVWVIGVDQDEYLTTFKRGEAEGSDKLLSSAMKRVDNAVYTAVKAAVEGTFKGGTYLFEAANDGVGLAPFHEAEDAIPAEVKAKLEEIAAGLKDGSIQTGVTL